MAVGVFGTGAPILRIMYTGSSSYATIQLPKPQKRTPKVVPVVITEEADNGAIVHKRVGYRVKVTLEYNLQSLDDAVSAADWKKICDAFNAEGFLWLTPYGDNPAQVFAVYLTNESSLEPYESNKSQYGRATLVYEAVHLAKIWKSVDDYTMVRTGAVYANNAIVFAQATRPVYTNVGVEIH